MALAAGPVILASASPARAMLLRQAGLEAEILPASVDEETVRDSLQAEGLPAPEIAVALAELKALRISRGRPGAFVIGADQILACDGVLYAKPGGREAAAAQLRALRGRRHELATAVCVAKDGGILWHHASVPALTMRRFSDDFLAAYLDAAGETLYGTVGAYALEGPGIQLFSAIEGDYFSILGLPLLPLLDFLRGHHIVAR